MFENVLHMSVQLFVQNTNLPLHYIIMLRNNSESQFLTQRHKWTCLQIFGQIRFVCETQWIVSLRFQQWNLQKIDHNEGEQKLYLTMSPSLRNSVFLLYFRQNLKAKIKFNIEHAYANLQKLVYIYLLLMLCRLTIQYCSNKALHQLVQPPRMSLTRANTGGNNQLHGTF